MDYFFLIVVWGLGTSFAWRRILSRPYSWFLKAVAMGFTLLPVFGPLFYLLIDPPEYSPADTSPEELWQPRKGAGLPWPSFNPLIQSLRKIFANPSEDDN